LQLPHVSKADGPLGVLNWWVNEGSNISEQEANEEMKKKFNWDYIEKTLK
jgi:hypothetical protein